MRIPLGSRKAHTCYWGGGALCSSCISPAFTMSHWSSGLTVLLPATGGSSSLPGAQHTLWNWDYLLASRYRNLVQYFLLKVWHLLVVNIHIAVFCCERCLFYVIFFDALSFLDFLNWFLIETCTVFPLLLRLCTILHYSNVGGPQLFFSVSGFSQSCVSVSDPKVC
jgi:hypothetical protein